MPTRKPPILPGEPLCACVPKGIPADDYEMFVALCECMYLKMKNGDMLCVECMEDINTCGCALVHSPGCEDA